VAQVAAALPPDRPLRVLEIGGGTGGTTAGLLEVVPPDRTDYLFTDVSPLFTTKAQASFADKPFLRFATLDIEKPPAAQGIPEGGFDLVIAANVLHATADLRRTLCHARSLLASGGLLVLLEVVNRHRWVDLVFGLTEGWWRFIDSDLRPDAALLDESAWRAVLGEAGFADARTVAPPETGTGFLSRQAVVLARAAEQNSGRRWLIVDDGAGTGAALAARLNARGDSALVAGTMEQAGDPGMVEGWCGGQAGSGLHGVVALAPALADPSDAARLGCAAALHLVQGLARHGGAAPPRLWLVTHGAQPAGTTPVSAGGAALWGLGKVVAAEYPELRPALIDLDPAGGDPDELVALLTAPGEPELALRDGRRLAPRLVAVDLVPAPPFQARPDASYLVTGGVTGIGLQIARWLVDRGARHLVLVSRRGAPPEAAPALDALRAAGAQVEVWPADIADPQAVTALLARIDRSRPPLRGIVHSAGVFQDRLLRDHDWQRFATVFAAKIAGTWGLHEQTRDRPLDLFLLCSSVAALFGTAGLGNYVAANAFQDGLAWQRRQLGLPALSVNWGPWARVGMAEAVGSGREQQWAALGIATMSAEEALAGFARMPGQPQPQLALVAMDWPRFFARIGDGAPPPFYAEIARMVPPIPASAEPDVTDRLRAAAPVERRALLTEHISAVTARVLGFDPAAPLDPREGLFQMGMDSLTSVELRNRLQSTLSCTLASTLAFKYPTIEALVDHLARDVLGFESGQTAETEAAAPAEAADPGTLEQELAELEALLGAEAV
jgi:NAD(P)-dependent dehydrogenase (short-subunit alcohol dehydrogenase family)/acyl carrier protein